MKIPIPISLLVIFWIVPIMAFPTEPLQNNHFFAYIYAGNSEFCYAPLPIAFTESKPADFFMRSSTSYGISPHWKYWIGWGRIQTVSEYLEEESFSLVGCMI
jgi:hypothetical protein